MVTRAEWDAKLLWVTSWLTVLALPLMLAGPAPMDVAVSLVAVLFLARSAIMRDWLWLKPLWVRLLLCLWIWCLLSSAFAQSPLPAYSTSGPWIRFVVLAAALAYWILPDAKIQKRLFVALGATVLFLCADALLQYFTGHDIIGRESRVIAGQTRLSGPFHNWRVGITLTWIAFPFVCALLAKPGNKARLVAIAVTSLVVVTAFISGERMGFLLSVMGVALSFILVPKARLPLIATAAVAALTLGGLMQAHPALKERQVGQSGTEIKGFWQSSYGQLWLSSLHMLKAEPIHGVGPRNFRIRCPEPQFGPTDEDTLHLRCTMHPHNIYMEWLAETGIVGFALFIAVVSQWLLLLWQERRAVFSDALLGGLLVALLIRLWPLSATASQFVPWSAGPFWICIGWMIARLMQARRARMH